MTKESAASSRLRRAPVTVMHRFETDGIEPACGRFGHPLGHRRDVLPQVAVAP